ncbi:MAG: GNAT family N-acetyltransferase [Armatimonadetes bacterium]|nr:GNAT family N-acetyltransferase [Armatimonadota bacterium]
MLRLLNRRDGWPYPAPGGRVRLRPLEEEDVQQIRAWLTDRELIRLAFGTRAEDEALDRLARDYCREIATGRGNALAVESTSGQLIGFVRFNLRNTRTGRNARVGILIGDRGYWNCGLGTEAMEGLIAILFTRRKASVIELDTADFNLRAQRCFEKCGFERRAKQSLVSLENGQPSRKIWMELSRAAWEQRLRK